MTCATSPAQKGHPITMARMAGLATAAKMLEGQDKLAAALNIEPRSLRAKLDFNRGISNDDLISAANALEAQAKRVAAHALKLRDEAAR